MEQKPGWNKNNKLSEVDYNMSFEEMKEKKTIVVLSHRIGEILVTEFGLKELVNIQYLEPRNENDKQRKVYIFRNSPELFEAFCKYAYNESYAGK